MKKSNNSTAQLIGAKSFSRNGVLTANDELVFFAVKPTNISVLSDISVGLKVKNLMYLLTAQPDLEICCLDDQESFDDNKTYLKERIAKERNPKVKSLLERDLAFLDNIQVEMSTARQFMIAVRIHKNSETETFSFLNHVQKAIASQGFDVRRAKQEDIKRFITLYFLRAMPATEIPDVDGEPTVKKWIIPDT